MNVMLKKYHSLFVSVWSCKYDGINSFFFFVMICIIKAAIKGADLIQSQIHIFILPIKFFY